MNDNLRIYNAVRAVPKEAQKQIMGGRLKGFTDINPQWRIKTLTEQFGVCGFGWKYEIEKQWYEETRTDNVSELTAHVKINLYVKDGEQWSAPIPGIGGSMLIAKEKSGLYVDDECYKKALTDAISVACKALGFGADVYWDKDRTKYDQRNSGSTDKKKTAAETPNRDKVFAICQEKGVQWETFKDMYSIPEDWKNQPDSYWEPILAEMEGR